MMKRATRAFLKGAVSLSVLHVAKFSCCDVRKVCCLQTGMVSQRGPSQSSHRLRWLCGIESIKSNCFIILADIRRIFIPLSFTVSRNKWLEKSNQPQFAKDVCSVRKTCSYTLRTFFFCWKGYYYFIINMKIMFDMRDLRTEQKHNKHWQQ